MGGEWPISCLDKVLAGPARSSAAKMYLYLYPNTEPNVHLHYCRRIKRSDAPRLNGHKCNVLFYMDTSCVGPSAALTDGRETEVDAFRLGTEGARARDQLRYLEGGTRKGQGVNG